MSIELPVVARHRRDMTEKLLKEILNQNKQNICQYDTKFAFDIQFLHQNAKILPLVNNIFMDIIT